MKTEKGYRFNIQFPGTTEQERLVGEFLESLVNKKSEFIIPILYEYLIDHQELLQQNTEVRIEVKRAITEEELEAKVLETYNRLVASGKITAGADPRERSQSTRDKTSDMNAKKLLQSLQKFK